MAKITLDMKDIQQAVREYIVRKYGQCPQTYWVTSRPCLSQPNKENEYTFTFECTLELYTGQK